MFFLLIYTFNEIKDVYFYSFHIHFLAPSGDITALNHCVFTFKLNSLKLISFSNSCGAHFYNRWVFTDLGKWRDLLIWDTVVTSVFKWAVWIGAQEREFRVGFTHMEVVGEALGVKWDCQGWEQRKALSIESSVNPKWKRQLKKLERRMIVGKVTKTKGQISTYGLGFSPSENVSWYLWSVCYIPSTLLNSLHVLTFNFHNTLWGRCFYYTHFYRWGSWNIERFINFCPKVQSSCFTV